MDRTMQWWQIAGREGVPDCDALVQLTGEPYMALHTVPDRKFEEAQFHSRGGVTELLAYHMRRTKWKPRVFVQASNAGIYPARCVSQPLFHLHETHD